MLVGELEDPAAAARDAGQRIVGDDHRQAGFFHEQLVDVAQQRAAAGEHDAALGDVGAEFRRGLLERLLDRADDALQRFLQRLEDLVGVQREAARHAFGEVAALDRHLAHLLAGIGRADLDLDALGGGFADQDAVVAAHVVDDRFVEAVAADAHARRRRRCRSARSPRLRRCRRRCRAPSSRAPRAPAGRRRPPPPSVRYDQAHAARAGALGRFLDRAALDLGRAERHAHQHARARAQEAIAVHLLDEVLQHLLGVGEVGDHAVLHRPHRGDVAGRAAEHVLGFGADRDDDLAAARRFVLDRDHRRLVQHDAAVADVDQRVGGAKVDREIVGEITAQAFEHGNLWL